MAKCIHSSDKTACYYCSKNTHLKRVFEKWWEGEIKDAPEHFKHRTNPSKDIAFYVWKNAFLAGKRQPPKRQKRTDR